MDDEFTSTAYPKVQENLKLLTEGDVRLEEPASSARTLSSMKNLDKEFSFTDQFLIEKSQEDEQKKTNTRSGWGGVQSMMMVPIHQDTSILSHDWSAGTEYSRSGGCKSSPGGKARQAREQDPPIGDSRLNYDKGHEDHKMAFEALQKSIIRDESKQFDADKAEERTKKKSKQDSPKTPPGSPPPPPPPPPPSGVLGASSPTGTSDSAQDSPSFKSLFIYL
ncbi:hypothetical protein Tco_0308129 [Tanacetum coccineum]